MAFTIAEPSVTRIAGWVARGLTAYDAVYVALAEERALRLITTDQDTLAIAPDIAEPPRE